MSDIFLHFMLYVKQIIGCAMMQKENISQK